MTRARTASYGVVTPPPLDRWIEAVLMLCVSLVQGAATTLGMILNRNHRDWHTADARDALPQAKAGISSQGTNPTHGVILGIDPRISVGPTKGLSIDPLETRNQDSRVKPENDTVGVATLGLKANEVRIPHGLSPEARRAQGEGKGPALRAAQTHTHRSALTRADQTPALILSLSKDAGDAVERLALRVSPARL